MMQEEEKKTLSTVFVILFMLFFGAIAFLWIIPNFSNIEYANEIYSFSIYQSLIILFIISIKNRVISIKDSFLKEVFLFLLLFSVIFLLPLLFISGFSSPEDIRVNTLKNILNYYLIITVFVCISAIFLERKQKRR